MAGLIDLCGIVGPAALALCGLPQAIQVARQGHARGMGWPLLSLWLFGEVLTLVFVACTVNDAVALVMNYAANAVIVGVMCWYRAFPRN